MSFLRPIQWYHSHADPIWPDGTFKLRTVAFLLTGLDFLSAAANLLPISIFHFLEVRGGSLLCPVISFR